LESPTENYWSAQVKHFFRHACALGVRLLVGAAVIGAPIAMALSRRGLATVPSVLGVSVVISLLFTGLLVLLGAPSPSARFVQMAPEFVGIHLVLSLGFCIGAGLQWRIRQRV